jgi:hypothetical protein
MEFLRTSEARTIVIVVVDRKKMKHDARPVVTYPGKSKNCILTLSYKADPSVG